MNSATKNYIKRNLFTSTMIYIMPILIILFIYLISFPFNSGNPILFNHIFLKDFLTEYSVIITFLIGIALIYQYRFLYNDKNKSLVSQYPIKEIIKILVPLLCLLIPVLIYDIIVYGLFPENNSINAFLNIYLKYFILAFGLLFITSSKSVFKLVVICIIASFATVQSSGLVATFSVLSFSSTMIVILLCSLAILVAVALHFYWLYKHDENNINLVYYLELVAIFSVFFRSLFILKYPYVFEGLSLRIGEYSISIVMYILTVLIIVAYIYYREQRFAFKKMLLVIIPIFVVSISYIVIDSITDSETSRCKRYINGSFKGDVERHVAINEITIGLFSDSQLEVKEFMESNAKSCYQRYSENDNFSITLAPFSYDQSYFNYQEVGKNNDAIVDVANNAFLVKKSNTLVTDIIDKIDRNSYPLVFKYQMSNKTYYLVYLPQKFDDTKIKILKDELKKTKKDIIYLDDSNDKQLVNDIILNNQQSEKYSINYLEYYTIEDGIESDEYGEDFYSTININKEVKKKLDKLVKGSVAK